MLSSVTRGCLKMAWYWPCAFTLKKKNTRKFCDFSLRQQILLTVVPYICVLLFLGFCWLSDQVFLLGFAFKMVALAEHSRGSMQGAGKARHRTGVICQGWSSFSREPWPAPGPGGAIIH